MGYMNRILIVVFLFFVVPYLGLPRSYDIWIILPLVVAFVYSLYRYVLDNDVRLKVPKNLEDDFFEQNREEILSDSEVGDAYNEDEVDVKNNNT